MSKQNERVDRMTKRLQVFVENEWKYVFCRNELKKLPIITDNRQNAIKGDNHSLQYFQSHYASLEFRII